MIHGTKRHGVNMIPGSRIGNDHWRTPRWLMEIFKDRDDPCPNDGADGLDREWGERTYVNPPYSSPMPWVKKAIVESMKGKTIVMLLKHDSSTQWYRMLHENGAHFLMFSERLRFSESSNSPPFPSVLVVLQSSDFGISTLIR